MKLLHSSDWHLGRTLLNRPRHQEFELFLDWLRETVVRREIDILLIAGDVFDTSVPGPRSQRLYYDFLSSLAATPCRHVVVIGGNHDSPQLLDAPKAVFRSLRSPRIHVVGGFDGPESLGETPPQDADARAPELILLRDEADQPAMIVCAVPYLRERAISWSQEDDTETTKERRLVEAIVRHYREIARQAVLLRTTLPKPVPIIGMGHLFAVGGPSEALAPSDGTRCEEHVRDLYVGTLGAVPVSLFPTEFDYMALGHLHTFQTVGPAERGVHYSGSPLPMGFGEAAQHKFVLEVAFDSSRRPTVEPIRVPCFRRLFSLRGDRASIESQVTGMVGHSETASPLPPWIEIQLNEPLEAFQLGTEIERLLAPLGGETLRYTAERFTSAAETTERRLEDLDERRALELRLEAARIPEEQRKPYRDRYGEILFQMRQESMEKQTVARLPGNHQ